MPCQGVLRFFGRHKENGELRAGIELDVPIGKNNGTVGGNHYFTCADKHGFLCHPRFVIRVSDAIAAGIAAPNKDEALKGLQVRSAQQRASPLAQQQTQRKPQEAAGSVLTLSNNVSLFSAADVGTRVQCEGMACGATLRFVGLHKENGEPRVGVELDEPVGKNNGTVGGHAYFQCADKCGLLCHPMHVSRAVAAVGAIAVGVDYVNMNEVVVPQAGPAVRQAPALKAATSSATPAAAPDRLDHFGTGPTAGSVPYLDVAPDPESDGEVDLDELDVDKPARLLTDFGDSTQVTRRMSQELSGVVAVTDDAPEYVNTSEVVVPDTASGVDGKDFC